MCNLENVFSQLTNMIYSLYVYKENISESYQGNSLVHIS